MSTLETIIAEHEALKEFRRRNPLCEIYSKGYDDCDPNFDIAANHRNNLELIRQKERILDDGMKQIVNIVTLANNDYHHPSLNEEYEKIATKYHNKEITRKQFLEEYGMLKVAMKLIDE